MGDNPFFMMLLGLGTVFAGLALLILIIRLLALTDKNRKKQSAAVKAPLPAPVAARTASADEKLTAAVSAAIATVMGADVSAIRILYINKK